MAPSKETKFVSDLPQLLAEWDWEKNNGLSPFAISYGSAKRAWWKCADCGCCWESPVYSRGANGCGCPECAKTKRGLSKKRSAAQQNSFLQQFPKIAKEWHPSKNAYLNIEEISAYSNQKVWWKCAICGNEWETSVNHRTKEGNSCPVCSRRRGAKQKVLTHAAANNFALQKPAVAQEWHPFKNGKIIASDVSLKSNKKVWWLCSFCGFEWEDTVSHRSSGRGCPNCSMAQTSFAEQAVYYYVAQIFPDAINRYNETYELDIFIPSINVAIEYDGFWYHQSQKNQERDNLKDEHCHRRGIRLIRFRSPRLCDTLCATRITCEEHRLEEGIRELFSILLPSLTIDIDIERDSTIIRKRFRQVVKQKSLAVQQPQLVKEWHPTKNIGLAPDAVYAKSNIRIWWQCSVCGYEWKTTANHRSNGQGCPKCVRKKAED